MNVHCQAGVVFLACCLLPAVALPQAAADKHGTF